MTIRDKVTALAIGMFFAGLSLASIAWGATLLYMGSQGVAFVR